MPDAQFVEGDDTPALEVTLESGDSAVDLSNATNVQFHMKRPDASALTVDASATITAPSSGQVLYDWTSSDLSEAGYYEAEFEISWTDGTTQTWPAADVLTIDVRKQLD